MYIPGLSSPTLSTSRHTSFFPGFGYGYNNMKQQAARYSSCAYLHELPDKA